MYYSILELMLFVLQQNLKHTEYKLEKKIPGLSYKPYTSNPLQKLMDSTDIAMSRVKTVNHFLNHILHISFQESILECFSNDTLQHNVLTDYFLPGHCLENTE